jgi:hypothetical protein
MQLSIKNLKKQAIIGIAGIVAVYWIGQILPVLVARLLF